MAKYKYYDYSQSKLIPVSLQEQLIPGTLGFAIHTLVDEKIDKSRDNWGIEPLPNLDFKIMQGNSLISEFMVQLLKERGIKINQEKVIKAAKKYREKISKLNLDKIMKKIR